MVFGALFFQPIHFEINVPDRKSVQKNGYPSRESARKNLYLEIWAIRFLGCPFQVSGRFGRGGPWFESRGWHFWAPKSQNFRIFFIFPKVTQMAGNRWKSIPDGF